MTTLLWEEGRYEEDNILSMVYDACLVVTLLNEEKEKEERGRR